MVINKRQCSACKGEMLLDHVEEREGVKTMFYACVNPNCKEHGKAYSLTGKEQEAQIKPKERV